MGEEGCERFTWAFESTRDATLSSSPRACHKSSLRTSESPIQCHHTALPELLSSSPSVSVVSATTRLRSKKTSLPTSSTSTTQHRTPSIELSPEPSHTQRCITAAYAHERVATDPTTHAAVSRSSSFLFHCRVWPFNFYAHEMDTGFKMCCDELNQRHPVEKVFRDHFHTKFAKSTFYDHRRHWMSVSSLVREWYIGYGNTKHGRWSMFLRQEIKGRGNKGPS
jgi:hypothetical protein